jgi:hypothetical protein
MQKVITDALISLFVACSKRSLVKGIPVLRVSKLPGIDGMII